MASHNETKWSWHKPSTLCWSALATIAVLGGCAGLAPAPETTGSGINLEYLFGGRRPVAQADVSLIDDPEYAEYLDWKRWRDFQAYQEWRRRRDEQGTSSDAASN